MFRSPIFVLIASIICLVVGLTMKSSYIEIFASVTGIINVWLLARERVLNFAFGIMAVSAFIYIFYTQGLYAMVVLTAVQLVLNVYGWYYWKTSSGTEDVRSTVRLDAKGWTIYSIIIVMAWLAWSWYQIQYLGSEFPYLDALTAVLGLIAQYMLSKKILETWHLWIVYNIVTIVVFLSTELYVMIILAVINLALCVDGLLDWKRNYDRKRTASA
ncbi:nicotinamide riboside transporter PnuC [Paenibacillus sp. 481]|uniref:nicotinamide riboside transporter PnuC n=1 Tax=Paenibacillus sp. 481 TaxID=2835869 RepID=UPI001E332F34|nr:nicotinamide riboside transporter PnuC [Paenibacillus sp. 481]UHA75070.1 nicotinamide riboside transporter PnuC [Paenibacillus sp. 481]